MSKFLKNCRIAVVFLVVLCSGVPAWAEDEPKPEEPPQPAPAAEESATAADPAPIPVIKPSSAPAPEGESAPAPSVNAAPPSEYSGTYKSGNAPLKEKTKIKLLMGSSSFEAVPVRKGVEPWRVPVQKLRGATAVEKGVWVYWFTETGAVEQAYIEMAAAEKDAFADSLNKTVRDYYRQPLQAADNLKSNYETYKEKALKEAR